MSTYYFVLSKQKVNLSLTQVPEVSEEHVTGSHVNATQQTKSGEHSTQHVNTLQQILCTHKKVGWGNLLVKYYRKVLFRS